MADSDLNSLKHSVCQTRNELNNIRKSLCAAKEQFKKDFNKIELLVKHMKSGNVAVSSLTNENISNDNPFNAKVLQYTVQPIGFMKSIHEQKTGTPRQGSLSSLSRGILKIRKSVFNNPSHSLEGLNEYSYIWLSYIFHKNKHEASHAKVSPPRLDGTKIGVFASRSPHRPNALGLTLAHLDFVKGDTVYVSGIDILDGTPIVDIKPFIPNYDLPQELLCENETLVNVQEESTQEKPNKFNVLDSRGDSHEDNLKKTDFSFKLIQDEELKKKFETKKIFTEDTEVQKMLKVNTFTPSWVNFPPAPRLQVIFNPIAEKQIKSFSSEASIPFRLEYLKSSEELKSAISCVLSEDPRSCYRRQKCSDRLFYFTVDCAHVTAFFVDSEVEVLRVIPSDRKNP
ncbi:UNVERIFIED_CONTAM: hypothetical protein RMT77_004606 [Armadillidium vulgare]